MDHNNDSGIELEEYYVTIEKKNEGVREPHESLSMYMLSPLNKQLKKKNFKSLMILNEKEFPENFKKISRRNDANRRHFFSRGLNNGEKLNRKKYKKKFEKSNVSGVNIRKVTSEFVAEENDKLVNIVGLWKVVSNCGKYRTHRTLKSVVKDVNAATLILNDNNSVKIPLSRTDESLNANMETNEEPLSNILQCFEKLKLQDHNSNINSVKNTKNLTEVKTAIDYSSGDVQQNIPVDLDFDFPDENFNDMACAQIFDSKRRSVQWNREVDVIYYAGDSCGGRIVRRKNEPLREEIEQQSRRNKFIQLALTKKLLSNASACQLRDPWLVVLPK